ncbi:Bpu10I family restriction endonuclease [Candidatus Palauibacter sp.]|uniref:Bpu10I family restriction endonuclease n=1 Tax=Candidatus Palauibacter sp. TaxID=3101350 RepID=UPI003C6EBDB2
MALPTPHGDKLRALADNPKLPTEDSPRVADAIGRYDKWIEELEDVDNESATVVTELVTLLSNYKMSVDLDLVFDSPADFLYRQKGQIKLDNTILEEFLPWLVWAVFSRDLNDLDVHLGPATCFSAVQFVSELRAPAPGGGMRVRSKDQDFAIARKIYLRTSHEPTFEAVTDAEAAIAYLVAEIKTNLDKTMFQEAAATAADVKLAVPGARYLLLCEWLDMTPIRTAGTAIDEVVILRKSKRLSSSVRQHFANAEGRRASRAAFEEHLVSNPFSTDSFQRLLKHVGQLMADPNLSERGILERGWF